MYLRPCIVNNKKALFHRWSDRSSIVAPSPLIGGHQGGIIKDIIGIIEYEDGQVGECGPLEIRFLDGKFKEFCFK